MATTRRRGQAAGKRKVLLPVHKAFIVTRLAKFDTTTMVRDAFAKEFKDIETPGHSTIAKYDMAQKAGESLSSEWRTVFTETRAAFLKDFKAIPVANKSVRLHLLNDMVYDALATKNKRMAAEFLEQAAKESGDAFTNKVDVKHSGKIDTNAMSDADLTRGLARFGVMLALPNAGGGGA